ncbi:3842_t:CDS:2 [Diversispora eburnea]|uniref:3842_t:CDS:1 n=1 Tax=Diversispora eburnea TaxID=1213867 RepID=A0A9N8YNR2_9GLOM|nr:3842_t:CDS:2 [Diversispora eburnea]
MSITYFDTIERNYSEVSITDEGIDTKTFLEATEGLVKLFDLLESKAFIVVKNDMNGNIKKIRERYLIDTIKNSTLESLVINEKGEKKRKATEGLLWLKRGLEFTSTALRRSKNNKDEELSASFRIAYEGTLRLFHGFVVVTLFNFAMDSVPTRAAFFKKLGEDELKIEEQYEIWLLALEKIVARLVEFYIQGGHDKGF